MYWILMLILFCVALIFCSMGFKKFVWFLSVGYGMSIFGLGLAFVVILLLNQFSGGILEFEPLDTTLLVICLIQAIVLMAYGFRLGGFLFIREIRSAAYNREVKSTVGNEPPIFVKAFMWPILGILYLAQVSGLAFKFLNGTMNVVVAIVGIVISILGAILEAVADKQKSAQKKIDAKMVATKGLYKFVRCPNYFGEILFWTGTFVSGIGAYFTVFEWIFSVLAYVCIVYIMFNGAQRLEKRQSKRLGDDPRYIEYVNKTPIIIPLIPLYHLYNPVKEAEKVAKKQKDDVSKEDKPSE